MTAADLPHADDVPPLRDWSASGGPDLFTLRAWLEVEAALEEGHPLDTAVAFLQDRVTAIFGSGVLARFGQFAAQHALEDQGLSGLLEREDLLESLLAFLLADDEAPDLPDGEHEWRAAAPGRSRSQRPGGPGR